MGRYGATCEGAPRPREEVHNEGRTRTHDSRGRHGAGDGFLKSRRPRNYSSPTGQRTRHTLLFTRRGAPPSHTNTTTPGPEVTHTIGGRTDSDDSRKAHTGSQQGDRDYAVQACELLISRAFVIENSHSVDFIGAPSRGSQVPLDGSHVHCAARIAAETALRPWIGLAAAVCVSVRRVRHVMSSQRRHQCAAQFRPVLVRS